MSRPCEDSGSRVRMRMCIFSCGEPRLVWIRKLAWFPVGQRNLCWYSSSLCLDFPLFYCLNQFTDGFNQFLKVLEGDEKRFWMPGAESPWFEGFLREWGLPHICGKGREGFRISQGPNPLTKPCKQYECSTNCWVYMDLVVTVAFDEEGNYAVYIIYI